MLSFEKRMRKYAQMALDAPAGLGIPFLEERDESWAPYLRFMHYCVQGEGMRFAVELGTFNGTCAAHMAAANPYAQVIAIDIAPQEAAFEAAANYPNLDVWVGDSCIFHDQIQEFGLQIDMLFLDTLHDGITPRRELETYRDLLAEGALVVVDDLLGPEHLHRPMTVFWDSLPEPRLTLHELHPQRIALGVAYHDAPGFGVCQWT